MTIKIYRPEDSLQVYILKSTSTVPKLYPAAHLRIYTSENEDIAVKDELLDKEVTDGVSFTDMQDFNGDPIGVDVTAALSYLDKIIG